MCIFICVSEKNVRKTHRNIIAMQTICEIHVQTKDIYMHVFLPLQWAACSFLRQKEPPSNLTLMCPVPFSHGRVICEFVCSIVYLLAIIALARGERYVGMQHADASFRKHRHDMMIDWRRRDPEEIGTGVRNGPKTVISPSNCVSNMWNVVEHSLEAVIASADSVTSKETLPYPSMWLSGMYYRYIWPVSSHTCRAIAAVNMSGVCWFHHVNWLKAIMKVFSHWRRAGYLLICLIVLIPVEKSIVIKIQMQYTKNNL